MGNFISSFKSDDCSKKQYDQCVRDNQTEDKYLITPKDCCANTKCNDPKKMNMACSTDTIVNNNYVVKKEGVL